MMNLASIYEGKSTQNNITKVKVPSYGTYLVSMIQGSAWPLQGLVFVSVGDDARACTAHKICGGERFLPDENIVISSDTDKTISINNKTIASFNFSIIALQTV